LNRSRITAAIENVWAQPLAPGINVHDIRAMPDKSISERLDDCGTIQKGLQSELVSHSGKLDDLRKRIEGREARISELAEVIKQLQSDLRKDIQDLIQLEALNNPATNNASALSQDERNEYGKTMARLTKRHIP